MNEIRFYFQELKHKIQSKLEYVMHNAVRRCNLGDRKVGLACDPKTWSAVRSGNMRPPSGSGSHIRPAPSN